MVLSWVPLIVRPWSRVGENWFWCSDQYTSCRNRHNIFLPRSHTNAWHFNLNSFKLLRCYLSRISSCPRLWLPNARHSITIFQNATSLLMIKLLSSTLHMSLTTSLFLFICSLASSNCDIDLRISMSIYTTINLRRNRKSKWFSNLDQIQLIYIENRLCRVRCVSLEIRPISIFRRFMDIMPCSH